MKPRKRLLTLSEVHFMRKLHTVKICNCIHCGLSLAGIDAMNHYMETQTCLYCGEEAGDSTTDISL